MNLRYINIPTSFLCVWIAASSCGTSNLGDCPTSNALVKCSELSADDQIRKALNDQDLTAAQALLEAAITEEPDNYERYPLLAAVYGGLAGFDLLAIASSTSSGGGSSIMAAMDAFLPTAAGLTRAEYSAKIDLMGQAIATIEALPAEYRATSDTDKYAASAVQQLGIFQAAQASMYMKMFTFNFDTGLLDATQLSSMSDADAAAILAILTSAAAGGGVFGETAAATLASISAGGGSVRDNLANFLSS